jgi:KDO2-lipid IV(A) lauroyltransferase
LGQPWRARQRVKNDLLYWLISVALLLARLLPLRALRAAGVVVGRIAYVLLGRARRIALANVARVYPRMTAEERTNFVRRCFDTHGAWLGEAVALLRPGVGLPALRISAHARSLFAEAHAAKQAVIFASGHLGPWELVAASLVAARIPLVTLARESYDPRLTRLYERLRARHGVRVIWRDRPGSVARIVRTLRTGGVLGVPMDLKARVPSCDAVFLGSAAPTAVGPARLALRARACVLVGTIAPADDGGVEVTATSIETADLQTDDDGAHVLTGRINAELSRRILAMPHAWVWMHERWPNENRI